MIQHDLAGLTAQVLELSERVPEASSAAFLNTVRPHQPSSLRTLMPFHNTRRPQATPYSGESLQGGRSLSHDLVLGDEDLGRQELHQGKLVL